MRPVGTFQIDGARDFLGTLARLYPQLKTCRWLGVQAVGSGDLFKHDLDLVKEMIQPLHAFGESVTKQTQLRRSGLPELEVVATKHLGG